MMTCTNDIGRMWNTKVTERACKARVCKEYAEACMEYWSQFLWGTPDGIEYLYENMMIWAERYGHTYEDTKKIFKGR